MTRITPAPTAPRWPAWAAWPGAGSLRARGPAEAAAQ